MSKKRNMHTSTLLSVKELAEKARLHAKSAKAPSMMRAYTSDWLHFENWCQLHRRDLFAGSSFSQAASLTIPRFVQDSFAKCGDHMRYQYATTHRLLGKCSTMPARVL
jgi:hypothetical protein